MWNREHFAKCIAEKRLHAAIIFTEILAQNKIHWMKALTCCTLIWFILPTDASLHQHLTMQVQSSALHMILAFNFMLFLPPKLPTQLFNSAHFFSTISQDSIDSEKFFASFFLLWCTNKWIINADTSRFFVAV